MKPSAMRMVRHHLRDNTEDHFSQTARAGCSNAFDRPVVYCFNGLRKELGEDTHIVNEKRHNASKRPKAYPYWHQVQFAERNPFPV